MVHWNSGRLDLSPRRDGMTVRSGQGAHCRGLRLHSDTPHSSGRVIGPSHRQAFIWQYTILSKRRTSIPSAGFEPEISSASERPQTHAFDRAAAGIGNLKDLQCWNAGNLFSLNKQEQYSVCWVNDRFGLFSQKPRRLLSFISMVLHHKNSCREFRSYIPCRLWNLGSAYGTYKSSDWLNKLHVLSV
jgi:hypothetical protein